jgi:hypothetical protein
MAEAVRPSRQLQYRQPNGLFPEFMGQSRWNFVLTRLWPGGLMFVLALVRHGITPEKVP